MVLAFHILHLVFLYIAHSDTIATTTQQEFENKTIVCTSTKPCDISCQHKNGCYSTTIHCPINHPCNIRCSHDSACANAIIYAHHSSTFELSDCATGDWTCTGLTIYFPPNHNGQPRAKIHGSLTGLSAGLNLATPLQFYATNGWKDVNITTTTSSASASHSYEYHFGTMHCTNTFSTCCPFKSDGWECANTNDICNNPPTMLPSGTYTE